MRTIEGRRWSRAPSMAVAPGCVRRTRPAVKRPHALAERAPDLLWVLLFLTCGHSVQGAAIPLVREF